MDKIKRNERIAALTRILVSEPNRVMPFTPFCERFGAAKSSISEDVAIIDSALRSNRLGSLETVAGAAGGVRFRPTGGQAGDAVFMQGVAEMLNQHQRVLPGGYLYLSDILADPGIVRRMGDIIACAWYQEQVDFVLTMETKGIPVALMAASALGVPLVIARRQSKVYEGSAVNISYLTGRGAIETMSLSRRAVVAGQRCLVVDDFTRGGGTARGLLALMAEFSVEVAGLSFVLAQDDHLRKPLPKEKPLMFFAGDGENEPLVVRPAAWLVPERS
ncbi:MAG: pur operon repressor [Christensenellales bacterium]